MRFGLSYQAAWRLSRGVFDRPALCGQLVLGAADPFLQVGIGEHVIEDSARAGREPAPWWRSQRHGAYMASAIE